MTAKQMQINAQNQTTPSWVWPNASVYVNATDPFDGWTAQEDTLYNLMRPAVPGLTA